MLFPNRNSSFSHVAGLLQLADSISKLQVQYLQSQCQIQVKISTVLTIKDFNSDVLGCLLRDLIRNIVHLVRTILKLCLHGAAFDCS